MQDDIDLGKYVRVLFKYYKIGLVLFAIVALVILASQLLQPATYTATTTLFASTPQYQWRFDSRVLPYVLTNKNWQAEFTEVAKDAWLKAEIAAELAKRYDSMPAGSVTVRAGKKTLIHIDATANSPQDAMTLANRWAEVFLEQIDNMYGTALLTDSFSAELADAEDAYRQAAEEVREFKARTGIGIASEGQTMLEGYEWLGPLGLELAAKSSMLADYQLAVRNLELLSEQIETAQAAGASLDTLSWELLSAPTIVARGQLNSEKVEVLFDEPASVAELIKSELAAQNRALAALEEEIARDQEEITQMTTDLDQLVEKRILNKEVYQTLQRKVDEIDVQSSVEGPLLRLATEASLPAASSRGDWLMIVVLAVVAGGVVGVAGCFAAEFIENRRAER